MYAESQKLADKFFNTPAIETSEAEARALKEHCLWQSEKPEFFTACGAMNDRGRIKKTETCWLLLEEHGAFFELYDYRLDQFDELLEAIDDYLDEQESLNALNYLD